MAEIRQSVAYLDDFVRANEDPLAGPTGTEWASTDTGIWNHLELVSNKATHGKPGGSSGSSSWKKRTYSGDDCEVWGVTHGGGANGIAWGVALFTNYNTSSTASGYRLRREVSSGGGSWTFRKWTNGSSTAVGTQLSSSGFTGGNYFMLMRRVGGTIESWYAPYSATPSWTQVWTYTDSTYVNNLYLTLSITDNSDSQLLSWQSFGGGPAVATTYPQIIRRTPRLNKIWLP